MNAFRLFLTLFTWFSLTLISFAQVINPFPTSPNAWGKTSLQTVANHKFTNQFSSYEKLASLTFENCASLIFVAPSDGEFKLTSNTAKEDLDVLVFRAETINFDQELSLSTAFILANRKVSKGDSFEASVADKNGFYEASRFQLLKGQSILVFVNSRITTTLDFTPEMTKVKDLPARAAVDDFEFRKNKASKTLRILVRDFATGFPMSAKVNIAGLKGLENVYNGSDLTFDLVGGKGAVISCTQDGYFNNTVNPKLIPGVDNVITIILTSFDINENMSLEGVQFIEGTAQPLPTAFPDLDKLIDFLKKNANIKIEVQGHVNSPDKESKAAQKLSEARAIYVRDYLLKNGIQPVRVVAKGYGNTKMIYEEPKNEKEEQANRRVEIKIFQ